MTDYKTPYYIVYEEKLRKNIELITGVAQRTGVDIIMAFKANALWRTFDVFREYGIESTSVAVATSTASARKATHTCSNTQMLT